jgi:hypothetical protein
MGEDQVGSTKPYDAFEALREMRDAYFDAMAKTMVEVVNTESYAQAAGAMLDASLTLSAPFKEALEKTMLQVLQQLSVPSRQDVLVLAERFTNFEMRLDDIDAKLDRIVKPLGPAPAKSMNPNRKTQPAERVAAKAPSAGKLARAPRQASRKRNTGKRAK